MAMQSEPSTSAAAQALAVIDNDGDEQNGPLPLSKLEVSQKKLNLIQRISQVIVFEGSFGYNKC